jgi:CRP/FNR family transcriptional regulator, cyclic AMP receptor protein
MSNLVAPAELRSGLNRIASVVYKKKGATLFRRGEPGSGLFIIRKGTVNLYLEGESQCYPSRALGEGAILGLPATLSGEGYSLTAETIEDAELGFVSRNDFLALMAKNPNLCLMAMHLLSKEIASIRSMLVPGNAGRRQRPPVKSDLAERKSSAKKQISAS